MYSLHDALQPLLSVVTSTPVIIVAAIAMCLSLLSYIIAPKYTPLEPPPLPHLLPFFGHALSFVRDQRAFFEWANKKMQGQPFSMLVAGDKLYIFHSPAAVSQIFRKSSALTITHTDQRNFRINIGGFRPVDADKVAELRENERQIHSTHLLSAEALEKTMVKFFEELDILLGDLGSSIAQAPNATMEKIGFNFIGDILMRATLGSLFGHHSFTATAYPHLFEDFRQFLSEHFFERMIGLPDFIARGAVNARERIKKRVTEVVQDIIDDKFDDVSGYIRDRIVKLGELGLSPEGVVSNEFDIIILGSNLNSIPITYLSLLHIISNPALLLSIQQELHFTSSLTLSASERAKLVPSGLPVIHALVREVLRYHSTAWSAREVTETTLLDLKSPNNASSRTYKLIKGGIIACPSSLLHHDSSIHVNPEIFEPKRFLSKELGGLGTPLGSGTLRPFGGGGSYCPGRLFAERQVVGCLAELVGRFDLEVIGENGGKKKWEIPRNADFFFVTKCGDVKVRVLKREGRRENYSAFLR